MTSDKSVNWRLWIPLWWPIVGLRALRRWFKRVRPLRKLDASLKRVPIGLLAVLFFVVSLGVGWLWLSIVPDIINRVGMPEQHWSWLEGLTSAASLAFAVGAGAWVLIQYSDTISNRNLEIYRDIYEKFMDEDQIEARRIIYQLFPSDPVVARRLMLENKTLHAAYKQSLSLLDYFGFLVDKNWVTDREVIEWISPIAVKLWGKIGAVVELERVERKEPDYYIAASHLVVKCEQWRQERFNTTTKDIHYGDHV